jgi:glycosyltransferase involved in cell wall biosynthesis
VSEPTVSVVIPAFNRSAFLRQSIASVLAQTYPDFELIISDDASTDDTAAVVGAFQDGRIQYFRNDRNLGLVANWNAGVRRAGGAYVTLLEDDNWLHPEYLARGVGTLEQHPEIAFMHTAVHLTNAQGKVMQVLQRWKSDRICGKRAELLDLMRGNKIYFSTVLARRSVIESLGLFDETIPFSADWDMWLRIYTCCDGAYVAEPLVYYRKHESNFTRQFLAQPSALFEDHRYVIEKTVQRIGKVYGVSFARRLRKSSYRFLADMLVWRAWERYLEGKFGRSRQEAALALQCDLGVTLRFPAWLVSIALAGLKPRGFGQGIAAMENSLRRWLGRHLC